VWQRQEIQEVLRRMNRPRQTGSFLRLGLLNRASEVFARLSEPEWAGLSLPSPSCGEATRELRSAGGAS
jgi:hypothetical protein